jgi:sporulation protein YlmC with PRC-barrel domain
MLKLYESTPGTSILSLRTGSPIATIISPVINPNNLYIEGWHVEDSRSRQPLILLSKDIRDVLPQGFAVNDHEVLSSPDELIRLEELIKLRFELLGLKVTSESGSRYGKINDYAFETKNLYVQKLYVAQSLVKNFSGGTLSIDRSQIIEVTNRRVIIEEPTDKSRVRAPSPGVAG